MKRRKSLYPERVLAEILEHQELEMPRTKHRIILGDSKHMDEIENGEIHLVVTSPPYHTHWIASIFCSSERVMFENSG